MISCAAERAWSATGIVDAILAFYLLAVRLTRCRVETIKHRPCRWRVRGAIGTCDYHVGYKRGLPVLLPPAGIGLPMLMWPRPDLATGPAPPEAQPPPTAHGAAATAPRARGHDRDWLMSGVGICGLLVAVASFIHALVHG